MQLKRLRKTGAAASQPADDSKTIQDISESQLLRDLEDLTGGLAADDSGDAGHAAALAAAAPAARCTATPAVGTSRRARRSGVASSGKRQRREFKPLFGSQDNELQQSDGGLGLGNSTVQQEQDDVDLDTLAWMQPQTTPPIPTGPGGIARGSSAGRATAAAEAAAEHSAPAHEDVDGWHMGRGSNHRATQQQQQQQQQQYSSQRMQQNSSYVGRQQQPQQQQQHVRSVQRHAEEEEDPIDVDSDSDALAAGGFAAAPGSAATLAAGRLPHTASRLRPATLISPRSSLVAQQQQQQRQRQRQRTPGGVAVTSPSGADIYPGQQQQQQQQRRSTGMCDLSRLLQPTSAVRAAAAPAAAHGNGAADMPGAANYTPGMQGDEENTDEDAWLPPKYKRQQQTQQQLQVPGSLGRPPAGRRVQPAAAAAGGSCGAAGTPAAGAYPPSSMFGAPAAAAGNPPVYATPAASFGGSHEDAAGAAAGGADAGDLLPWWTVLDDFVPVEVLVQSLVNPRDNTIVHINYKSQFKEGPAATRRTNTGAAAGGRSAAASSRKKSTTGARGKRGAAAAAGGGGFMTAGALAASQPAGRKGRRGSKKAGSGRSRGSGGGSSGGSKKRRGRGRRQGWRTIARHKVFVDASGRQLSGGAAYRAYKGGNN